MAKKKPKGRGWTLDKLGGIVKRGFESVEDRMERGFSAVAEDVAEVRKEMSTGFADVRKEMSTKEDVASIREELRDIKERLGAVEEAMGEHGRYSTEIDYAFERIAAIERHLGVKQKARTH